MRVKVENIRKYYGPSDNCWETLYKAKFDGEERIFAVNATWSRKHGGVYTGHFYSPEGKTIESMNPPAWTIEDLKELYRMIREFEREEKRKN